MTTPRDRALRGLLAVGIIELITLAVLFINLASGNNRGIAAAFGPIHGTAYLIGVILGWRSPLARWRKIITIVPGVGTLIATGWRRLQVPSRTRRRKREILPSSQFRGHLSCGQGAVCAVAGPDNDADRPAM
jgi:hypothetical protein